MGTPLADGARVLGAIWGFTRPFERISRFWRIDFIPKPQKSALFENCVKFDSRRLHIPRYRSVYVGGVASQVGFALRARQTWSTPAASKTFVADSWIAGALDVISALASASAPVGIHRPYILQHRGLPGDKYRIAATLPLQPSE